MRDNVQGGALTETTFLILLALYQPNHGYGIMQFIEQATHGRVQLGAGTLYGALNTLVEKGWIEPYNHDSEERRKTYRLTIEGKVKAQREFERLKEVLAIASSIMGGDEQ